MKTVLPLIKVDCEAVANKNSSILKQVIGQPEACRKLEFFVDSHSLETPFPTMLFSGSQGLGKSYMAKKVADALGRELVEVNCATIETVEDLFKNVLFPKVISGTPKTILFDESHQLSTEITTFLLTMLNPSSNLENEIEYKMNGQSMHFRYQFARLNIIFATTDSYKMFKPLVNRCTEIYFHLYSNEDLIKILKFYLPNISFQCNLEEVAYACRGRARDTYLLSANIQRHCNLNKTNIIDQKGWASIKNIFGIHAKGLTTQEIEYLRILEANAPASAYNMAIKMGVNVQNIESELEVRLKELNLIDSSSRGRSLTTEGKAYLAQLSSSVREIVLA